MIPALTTALTTAFIPALSPPDVRTASFILLTDERLGVAIGAAILYVYLGEPTACYSLYNCDGEEPAKGSQRGLVNLKK